MPDPSHPSPPVDRTSIPGRDRRLARRRSTPPPRTSDCRFFCPAFSGNFACAGELPRLLAVVEATDDRRAGYAVAAGYLRDEFGRREAMWRLSVRGRRVLGAFLLRGGEFVPVGVALRPGALAV
jgi:hypothetical protein